MVNGDAQPQNMQINHEEDEDEDDDLSDEFINVSAEDSASPSHNRVLTLPNIDRKKITKRNGRATHAQRTQRRITDRSHPLFVNDPVNRIGNMNIENETFGDGLCLHYVARGMCKFMNMNTLRNMMQRGSIVFNCESKENVHGTIVSIRIMRTIFHVEQIATKRSVYVIMLLRCDAYSARQIAYQKWRP
eukprot:49561_1